MEALWSNGGASERGAAVVPGHTEVILRGHGLERDHYRDAALAGISCMTII